MTVYPLDEQPTAHSRPGRYERECCIAGTHDAIIARLLHRIKPKFPF
jgi:hypothetical protein